MDTSKARLFPVDLPGPDWVRFPARGFSKPACGVIYRLHDIVTNGMPLGGVDTGCLDLETTGLLGYSTIFNTHVPRRGPINLPFLGISVDGRTSVLCHSQPKRGGGGWQYSEAGRPYNIWRGGQEVKATEPITPMPTELNLEAVQTATEIHYWGHYPVADLEFELGGPIGVGLRAWAPFLPGSVVDSMLPGAVFELDLRNLNDRAQDVTAAASFPGPTKEEAGGGIFARRTLESEVRGMEVRAGKASYVLGVLGKRKCRAGGELGSDGSAWSRIGAELPPAKKEEAGASVAADLRITGGRSTVVRFVLTWHAPEWNTGGYNWAGAEHSFVHMYAKHYPSARSSAARLARDHRSLLRRIIGWQQVVYGHEALPVWLRESLVNVLHMIAEDGLWAQAKPPVPAWAKARDGLFGMNECPRGCPQIECIPCSFYGNQPLVYLFPELALSTLRGYKGYQYPDGAPPWIFGGCTGRTPPIDFANPTRGYQFATNGISLAAMVDRYLLCHGTRSLLKEFYPVVKRSMIHTVNLRTTPSYSIGDRVIAMPNPDSDETAKPPTEWFEAPEPGWLGMTAHVGGLHLAELRIAERMARQAGDAEFAAMCADWIAAGAKSMEKLWAGSYYINYMDPDTGKRSDLVFGYQMDGEWVIRHHGLAPALPVERIKTTLETIKQCSVALSKYGAVNYANADGTAAKIGGYGTYSFFPPEALMLAMTYIYYGQAEFGLELARKVWHNIVCLRGYTWDMPNIMRGDADTGERTYGNDYYQDMMLWSLPAAVQTQDFGGPARPGGLVARIIRAARRRG